MPKPARSPRVRTKSVENGPLPGEISAAAMAESLGLTAQAIGQWLKRSGAPVRVVGKRTWVRHRDFQRWREAELCRQAVEEATRGLRQQLEGVQGGDPLTRKLKADARKAEIEVEHLERSSVTVEEAVSITGKLLTDLRAALAPLPRVWAPKLLGAKTVIEMEQRLHVENVRLMQLLSAPDFGQQDTTDGAAA